MSMGLCKGESHMELSKIPNSSTLQDSSLVISILLQQALLGEELDCSLAIPQHWWTTLCITTFWHIWLDQNAEVHENQGSVYRTKACIWQ